MKWKYIGYILSAIFTAYLIYSKQWLVLLTFAGYLAFSKIFMWWWKKRYEQKLKEMEEELKELEKK